MKILLTATTSLLISIAGSSQTKKIAFESHSGNAENFSITLNNELFDNGESDFGLPSSKSKYKIDSVIYLNDSSSVLVSKEYTGPFSAKSESDFKFVGIKKDTIYNNPLFSRNNSADSIRNGIKILSGMIAEYEASTNTIFTGFEKIKPKSKQKNKQKQQAVPLIIPIDPPDNNSPFDPKLILMLGSIFVLSIVGGWVSWKYYKPGQLTV